MELEIQIAIQFLVSFIVDKISKDKVQELMKSLNKALVGKFDGHWYPGKPSKGSGYRCISIGETLDSVLLKASKASGLDDKFLRDVLPSKLDLWVDPSEVSYRIGEHAGVTVIYKSGDDEINSSSKYYNSAQAILKKKVNEAAKHARIGNPPVSKGNVVLLSSLSQEKGAPLIPQLHHNERYNDRHSQGRRQLPPGSRLSPTARAFVSRTSPPLSYAHGSSNAGFYHSLPAIDYLRKSYWPVAYDPIANITAQNYLIAQELARYEAHRIALQTHYFKAPYYQWMRRVQHSSHGHSHTSGSSGQNHAQLPILA